MIPIDKDIPLPGKRHNNPNASIYAYRDMEIGDSFLYSSNCDKAASCRAAASSGAWGRRLGRKFTQRKMHEGIRVWRTE